MKINDCETDMELFGCYTCGELGGKYTEKIDGLIECNNCGEVTVITFQQALTMFNVLSELELLDEYHELVEHFGVVKFDDDSEFDLGDY